MVKNLSEQYNIEQKARILNKLIGKFPELESRNFSIQFDENQKNQFKVLTNTNDENDGIYSEFLNKNFNVRGKLICNNTRISIRAEEYKNVKNLLGKYGFEKDGILTYRILLNLPCSPLGRDFNSTALEIIGMVFIDIVERLIEEIYDSHTFSEEYNCSLTDRVEFSAKQKIEITEIILKTGYNVVKIDYKYRNIIISLELKQILDIGYGGIYPDEMSITIYEPSKLKEIYDILIFEAEILNRKNIK